MDEPPKPGDDKTPAAPEPAPPRPERGADENARRDSFVGPPTGGTPRHPAVVLPALLVSLAVAAGLGVGAAATASFWLPRLKGLVASPDPRIAGLESRVKALEERPPAQAPAPLAAPVPVPAPALEPVVDKAALDELARRLGESEARAADLARRLSVIEGMEAKTARTDPAAPALVLAVGQLRDAGAAGRPFVRELESLRALAQGRREVAEAAERLASLATKGVPTVSMLRERFDGVARAVTIAARAQGDGTWTDRVLARLSVLVAVRRTDDRAAEGTPDAALRAAEKALGQGDVAQAAAALETLSGPAQTAAKGWLADARARALLDATLADLHRRALAALAQGG